MDREIGFDSTLKCFFPVALNEIQGTGFVVDNSIPLSRNRIS